MAGRGKTFGRKNAPPPVVHAPGGLPNKVAVPTLKRKMSLTVGLVSLGAAAVAGGVVYENRRAAQAEECRAQAAQRGLPPDNCPTSRSSGGSYRVGGHSWYSSSSSSSSSATRGSTSHGGHATFGGFGHSGAAHAGGS
ncbi:MAG TPA: hypothetical protein PKA55_15840 [Rhodoblastus sp.]|nr:hypothetical protein [Rhodoblastus sp.]